MLVALALALAVMLWSVYWLSRTFEARAQEQLQTQQALEADLWARMLSARLEASQRLLSAIAQGMHTSLLDKPEILDALMRQEGSVLSLFESLHVALPSGVVSQHSLAAQSAALGPDGLSALRRTMAEGKPTVSAMPYQQEEPQYLYVLLTVPIRQVDGQVSAALAAMVKYPVALLLPDVLTQPEASQYYLLDRTGVVLAHADSTQRGSSIQQAWPDRQLVQRLLEQPASHHAENLQTATQLLTRVGLPLPQWQVVLLSDAAPTMSAWRPGLPWQSWLWLLGGTLGLAGLSSWWWRRQCAGCSHTQQMLAGSVQSAAVEHVPEAALVQPPRKSALDQARAALGAMPCAWLLHMQGKVLLMTSQASVLLGYCKPEAESMTLQQLVVHPSSCTQVQRALQEMTRFEGVVAMRKKDGDVLQVLLSAWTADEDARACVWQLQLPWRHRLAVVMPDAAHAARDSLTGLSGREAFLWNMQSWVVASMPVHAGNGQAQEQMPAQGCVLFADLDHLGMLNESTSRDMGNQVLAHVARLLSSYLQPLGDVARLGGVECVVLLPGVSLAHAQCIGQALCDAVWQWQPSWHGERYWISISVGVVAVDAQRHAPEEALRAADMACYEAKRRGRCQVAVGQISAQHHSTAADD